MKKVLIVLGLLLLVQAGLTPATNAAPLGTQSELQQAEERRFVSESCTTQPGANGTTNYTKQDSISKPGAWSTKVDFYADPNCTINTMSAFISGTAKITGASATIPGAAEAYLAFDVVKLTPKVPALVALFNSAPVGTCGNGAWELGQEQDLSGVGCSALGLNLKTCPGEYEVIKEEGNRRYAGARPADGGYLCTPERRPTSLRTVATIRQDAPAPSPALPQPGDGSGDCSWLLVAMAAAILASAGLVRRFAAAS